MKFLRAFVFLGLLLPALPALPASADLALQAPLPPSKDLYSFADLYRLTVGEPVLPATPQAANVSFHVRAVNESPVAAASPYVFSIGAVAAPSGGLLLLVGLAAALWVARRRLGYSIRG
jgi:hypothetical protein